MFDRKRNTVVTGMIGQMRASASRFGRWASLFALLIGAFVMAMLAAASPASAGDKEENYKVVQGLAVYLGVLPAAIVRGHAETHPEGAMHGGAPRGLHEYHILVAIFDASTGARVESAQLTAHVSGLGDVGAQDVELEPMAIAGTVTYGNFVKFPGNDRYDIGVDITAPGRSSSARVDFVYQHQL